MVVEGLEGIVAGVQQRAYDSNSRVAFLLRFPQGRVLLVPYTSDSRTAADGTWVTAASPPAYVPGPRYQALQALGKALLASLSRPFRGDRTGTTPQGPGNSGACVKPCCVGLCNSMFWRLPDRSWQMVRSCNTLMRTSPGFTEC